MLIWPQNAQLALQALLLADFALLLWTYGQFFKNIGTAKTFVLTLSAAVLNYLMVLAATAIMVLCIM